MFGRAIHVTLHSVLVLNVLVFLSAALFQLFFFALIAATQLEKGADAIKKAQNLLP